MRDVAEPIYRRLFEHYGPQHWWPAQSPFEVMVGALLVQRTSWRNAELAIAALRAANRLTPARLLELPEQALAELIRPSGTYRAKAARLLGLCRWLEQGGGLGQLAELPTTELRQRLLGVHGIGPETADAILLYAFGRPVFVIDAYSRRLFSRLGTIAGDESYERLRADFQSALPADASLLNEYHALIVAHGKAHCAARPRCSGCLLRQICDFAGADSRG